MAQVFELLGNLFYPGNIKLAEQMFAAEVMG